MIKQKVSSVIVATLAALAGAAALLLVLRGPAPARADSPHYVASDCTGVPAPCHTTIQAAVDAASPGDEIRVAMGHYTGVQTTGGGVQLVYISKTVTIRGGYIAPGFADPPDPDNNPTVLDAEGQGRVICINSSGISPTIEGLWITGGNASNAPAGAGRGGGIYSLGATPLIANNVITNNTAYTSTSSRGRGGGIYVENAPGTAVITGNQVLSNVASISYRGYGGGIYLDDAPSAQVTNNVVLSNTASITGGVGFGGGIAVMGSGGVTVTGNFIEYNIAQVGMSTRLSNDGGGIYCSAADDVLISGNTIRHNIVSFLRNGGGGGIALWGCDRALVMGNTIQENEGAIGSGNGCGGGLKAYAAADLRIEGNWIVSNTASNSPVGRGGGLYLSRNTTFTMTNNIVAANHASYEGGGLAFETGGASEPVTGTLIHNTFVANDLGSGEGRSAIHTRDPDVSLILTNNLIYSHTYGIYVVTTSTVHLDHTFFYAHSEGDTGGPGVIVNTDPITGQDPLLTADYHLGDGSPAIDAGLTLPWLLTDIDGDTRPQGTGYDVGADEFAWRYIYLPLVLKNYQ